MNAPRMVKIQVIDERGRLSHSAAKFPAHTLARFSRTGADEQGARVKSPSHTFEIHVDCSIDIFEMIIRWMRANENKEDVTKWSPIETARYALTIRQRAKLYEVALYHFKVVRGAEQVRNNLVNAIEAKQDAFTAEDVQYLKKILEQDSNLLIKIDKAAAKQFVLGWTHDDEVTKLQAWTGSRRADTKMGHLVAEYVQDLRKAGGGDRIRRDRWQDGHWDFPHINMGQSAVQPAPKIMAPPKNPWGTIPSVPAAKHLFGTKDNPSLPKGPSVGESSKAVDSPKSSPSKLAPSLQLTKMEAPSPKKTEQPQPGPASPAKFPLPRSNDTASEETRTETSGYLDSDVSLSTQGLATQTQMIQTWQAAQTVPQSQPSPPRPMTEDEWRIFTADRITIAKLEDTLAHGSLHAADFDRFYRLYHDMIETDFWATNTYRTPRSHVTIVKEYAYYRTASQTLYVNKLDDWLVYHAKEVLLDGFLKSVGGVGAPFGNLDFDADCWRLVLHMIVDGHRADLDKEEAAGMVLRWRVDGRVKSV